MPIDAIEPALRADTIRTHVVELVRLALPVIIARLGLLLMTAVDTIIVGRFSSDQLAYLGLGALPANILVMTGVGLLTGTIVMTAHSVGAGASATAGSVWRRSLPYAAILGAVAGAACLAGGPVFRAAGQEPALAAGGARVLAIFGLGLPAAMLYTTTAFFLEGLRRPLPAMAAMIAANLLNLALNWSLVWGQFGLPPLGAVGSAWSTTTVRWLMALALLAYAWSMPERARFGVRGPVAAWWRDGRAQRRLGYAAGASIGLEAAAFSALGLFAGWLGTLALGAFTIGLNLIALPFMAAVGLGAATAVRVGMAVGRRDHPGVVRAAWTGFGVTSAILACVAIAYGSQSWRIAAIYSDEPALLLETAPLVAFSAFILIADGGQTVMASALRGCADTWVPTLLHAFSYFGVMLPVSALLAFGLGHGVRGLFEGILIASLVSVGVLAARFSLLSRRDGLR